jgi:SAM-dependent methyltransferase
MILAVSEAPDYAFPHSAEDESRRLQLLEQRLDPLTKRRIQRLGVSNGARCLEIGGGRGSITRWLSDVVGPTGRVIATDLQLGFLSEIDASNVEVLRHDIRIDTFPPGSFELIHTRAVLMHISPSVDLLRRVVTWLAPGGWLVLEEPDFGMWAGDADPVWATSPVDPGRLPEHGPLSGPVSAPPGSPARPRGCRCRRRDRHHPSRH